MSTPKESERASSAIKHTQIAIEGRRHSAECILEVTEALSDDVIVAREDSHDDVAVTVEVLGDGVQNDIGA